MEGSRTLACKKFGIHLENRAGSIHPEELFSFDGLKRTLSLSRAVLVTGPPYPALSGMLQEIQPGVDFGVDQEAFAGSRLQPAVNVY